MKKAFLLFTTLILLISCSKETTDFETSNPEATVKQVFYSFDGEKYPIDLISIDGEFTLVENENSIRYKNFLDSENLVTYIDSDKNAPLYFSNMKEHDAFVSDEVRVAKRLEEIGLSKIKNTSDTFLTASSVPYFDISTAHRGLGYAATIPVSTYYSNRHVGFNQCITNGINFQDEISSMEVSYGLMVRFYVHDNYNGKVLVLDARNNPQGVVLFDLHDIKRRTFTFLDDSDDFVGYLCGALCTSWNDCITSIYAERAGVTGVRNYQNVCGTGSGGGGGGGGGGGQPLPRDLPVE